MRDRLVLALALQRLPFLRPDEKLLLWDLIDDEARLSVLSLFDVESLVCRRLEGRPWTPVELLREAEADALLLNRIGARYLHFDDPAYPPLLRETSRPPFGLYARGNLLDPDRPAAAVVGTRLATGRGLSAAAELGRELGMAEVPVVSGLARGIDSAAHRGAIEGRGATCAVLPCGIDRIYPPGNRALAASILESGGLLVSEYSPGAEIHKYRFPERNRIIAGLARACVVVEAPRGSGALITADHALGEGRDVWVSRVCLGGARSAGIDRLEAEGAPALGGADELLEDWGLLPARGDASRGRERMSQPHDSLRGGLDFDGENEGRRLAESLRRELALDAEDRGARPER